LKNAVFWKVTTCTYSGIKVYLRSASFWDFTQRRIPKERRSYLHRGERLKSRKMHRRFGENCYLHLQSKRSACRNSTQHMKWNGSTKLHILCRFSPCFFFSYRKHIAVSQKV